MIRFNHVNKRYPGGYQALKNVSFDIAKGEMVFVTGHSGAGKSTLLKLIAAIERPNLGSIIVNNQNVGVLKERAIPYLRRNLGIIFQDFQLLEDRNVYDNIAFTLHVTGVKRAEIKKKVLRILGEVGLTHQRNKMSHELSGGEQQRVAIARALVINPAVIMADEPTGALDSQNAQLILDLLADCARQGQTIVMVTHDANMANQASRVLVMHDGRIVEGTELPSEPSPAGLPSWGEPS